METVGRRFDWVTFLPNRIVRIGGNVKMNGNSVMNLTLCLGKESCRGRRESEGEEITFVI